MNRRHLLTGIAGMTGAVLCGSLAVARSGALSGETEAGAGEEALPPLDISRQEWRELLSADRFRILFDDETERAFSSPLDKQYDPGTYICAACYLPLFNSDDKFDSRTGWPSFTQPIEGRVETELDFKLIIPRTEYHCSRCGGHQGHVFGDGPPPTGKRWCNNGLALRFVPQDEELPALRTSA